MAWFEEENPSLPLMPSKIITTTEQLKALQKVLNPQHKRWRLLLDSSIGGSTTSAFDGAVKGKCKILIVLKSTTNFIFGAFVNDTFGQSGGWVTGSRETFLWTLGNNNTPVKLIFSGNGQSGHFTSCGLHLGDSQNELVAFCSNSVVAPRAYVLAPGFNAVVSDTLLAGANSYTLALGEVFELIE